MVGVVGGQRKVFYMVTAGVVAVLAAVELYLCKERFVFGTIPPVGSVVGRSWAYKVVIGFTDTIFA